MAGVVGQACVQYLSDRYELSGLDIKDPGNVPTLVADIADLNAILPAFEGVDAVVHLAGQPVGPIAVGRHLQHQHPGDVQRV